MTFKVVHGKATTEKRSFPVTAGPAGQPCIIGTAADTASSVGQSLFVLSPNGGRTVMYPATNPTDVLYEVRVGDYVAVYEVDPVTKTLYMNTYRVEAVAPTICTAILTH